jgi:hypothetical protein
VKDSFKAERMITFPALNVPMQWPLVLLAERLREKVKHREVKKGKVLGSELRCEHRG